VFLTSYSRRLAHGVAGLSTIVLLLSLAVVPAQAAPDAVGAVDRVVDGDTIAITTDAVQERVRFLNVDTPEVGSCLAAEATKFTKSRLPSGQAVDLKFDVELRDPYERLLALVRPEGGEWLSVELAEEGLGFPMAIAPNRTYYRRVAAAADKARRGGQGMFSPQRACTPVSRVKRAARMIARARNMPVRTRSQYAEANRTLTKAGAILLAVQASKLGIESPYFRTYVRGLKAPVRSRLSSVRALKRRQRAAVLNPPTPTPARYVPWSGGD
jgi:endonuclease YncB( thermonuclease family)